ncbi:unnamed protein product, partial [Pocillopora meandrina]
KSCGRPQIPLHGNIKSHVFTFRSKVYFECNPGFKLVGDKYRQCQANQTWSGRAPTCKLINCGNPDTPANVKQVSITNGFNYGSSVEFACEVNYTLEGSKIITCGETKEWSSSAPSCLGE